MKGKACYNLGGGEMKCFSFWDKQKKKAEKKAEKKAKKITPKRGER